MQAINTMPTPSSASVPLNEAIGGPLPRAAGKRASQGEGLDQKSKRAAFVFGDITNQDAENGNPDEVVLALPPQQQQAGALSARHAAAQQPHLTYDSRSPSDCGVAHQSSQAGPAPLGDHTRSHRPSWVDIDCDDGDDPMACVPYVNEIFHHLREAETRRRPNTTYMEAVQTDVNPAMRSILVDWLVEVGQEYRLSSDTLFLSVAYIDRYLSQVDVKRNRLQLVGVSAMLVAAKFEEIYAPQVEEFCYITDNTYSREAVLATERDILRVLEFDVAQPTCKTFLRRFIKAASGEIALDVTFEFLCSYLAELAMMDYGLLAYLPSHIAASCTLLALYMLGKPRWSATLTHYSGFLPADLKHCTQALHQLFLQARKSPLPASREKYASTRYGAVSTMGAPDLLPVWLFQ